MRLERRRRLRGTPIVRSCSACPMSDEVRTTRVRRIDGLVNLPVSLHVEASVPGLVLRVKIGDNPGRVAFPRVPDFSIPEAGGLSDLEEPDFGGRPLPELTQRAKGLGFGWGYISSSKGDTFIDALRVRIPIGDQQGEVPDQMSALGRAFDAWFSIVRDWLCAWTGQTRDRHTSRDECRIHATIRTNGKPGLYGSGVTLGDLVVIGERAATRDEVIAAFDCASEGYQLPLHCALLERAQSETMVGDYRSAVIDSCTAAEVSLSKALTRHLERISVPKGTVRNILRQAPGVVALFRLYVITGAPVSISEDMVMNRLARPRNDAAHAGDASTRERARLAIETAARILADTDALPTTVEARRSAHSGRFDQPSMAVADDMQAG
jgi:hypothetical protein